ncbi:MAG: hypothetical protein ACOCZL_05965, partial [Bacteroidota bacterium]
VKNDFFFDSRQTVTAREGHLLLYPANEQPDKAGEDINAQPSFNFLSIQTRLSGNISGPDAFGAKTSGKIEGAFFGHTNSDINGFRLRHAFMKLSWEKTELLTGQTWHLMFNAECFPGTVSFNTGVPFHFFSRNPQIRLSHNIGSLKLTGAFAAQRDFSCPGGSQMLRNSAVPEIMGRLLYRSSDKKFTAGLGMSYKNVVPRLQTDSLFKTRQKVDGIIAQGFIKMITIPLTFKFQGTYAENGYDGLMIGGFAVKRSSDPDPVRDYQEYTTMNNMSAWTDVHTNGKNFQFGLFAGYSQNLGANGEIENLNQISRYTRGSNIASLYRISPRIILNSNKTRFALELERTGAAYGDSFDKLGVPQNTKMVVNNRILLGAYYFF